MEATENQSIQSNSESASANNQVSADQDLKVNRSAEEYAKRLVETSAEAKKWRTEAQLAKQALQQKETEELESKGKLKEAIEKLRIEHTQKEREWKTKESSWTLKEVQGQLEREASKYGCVDTRSFVKLATAEGVLNELHVDENLNVSPESLKSAVDRSLKQWPFLFGKPAPRFADAAPGTASTKPSGMDFSKMSTEEIIEYARKNQDKIV